MVGGGVAFGVFLELEEVVVGGPGEGADFLEDGVGDGFVLAFPAWAGLPEAVHPEVLFWGEADGEFDGSAVAGGDVEEGVWVGGPVFRPEDVGGLDFVGEAFGLGAEVGVEEGGGDGWGFAEGEADDDGGVVTGGGEADGFVGGGEAVEEGDEDAAVAGVLVGDEAEGCAGVDDGGELLGGAELIDEDEAAAGADIADPFVGGFEIEWSVEGVEWEAEEGEGIAGHFPVAAMAADEDDGA